MPYFRASVVLAILLSLTSAVGAGEAEVARVREEYPSALERLEHAFAETKATGTLRSEWRGVSRSDRISFAKQQHLRVVSVKALEGADAGVRKSERVQCFSPLTSFTLDRRDVGEPYVLIGTKIPGSSTLAEIYLDRNLLAPFSIFDKPMSKMMAEPSFRIESVEVAGPDKKDLKITYRYFDKESLVGDGWVEVAPDAGWVIRKSSNQFSTAKATILCDIEYSAIGSGGFPLPTRVTYDLPGDRHQVFDFETITFEPTPEREFTPQFYGLPDLARLGKDPSSSSAPAWMFGLAALALAVAVGMKTLAGRLSRKGSAD